MAKKKKKQQQSPKKVIEFFREDSKKIVKVIINLPEEKIQKPLKDLIEYAKRNNGSPFSARVSKSSRTMYFVFKSKEDAKKFTKYKYEIISVEER